MKSQINPNRFQTKKNARENEVIDLSTIILEPDQLMKDFKNKSRKLFFKKVGKAFQKVGKGIGDFFGGIG